MPRTTTSSSLPILEICVGFGIAMAFSADLERLAIIGQISKLKLLDVETGAALQTLKGAGSLVSSVAFTADGQYLVSGSQWGPVQIWAVSTDVSPLIVQDHDMEVSSIAISADGLRAVSGSQDGTLKTWDTDTGTNLQTLEGHCCAIICVTFSADSRYLASGSEDATTKFWDTRTGTCLYTLKGDGFVHSVAFSTNGQYLASGSDGNTAKIWDTITGKCLYTFKHNNPVFTLAFSADSRYLATGTGSDDTIIRILGIKDHSFKALQGHTRWTTAVAFSVDSQYLASGSADGKIRIWDLEQCMCLHTINVGATLYRLSFDLRTNSKLYTDIGILDSKVPNPTPSVNTESLGITALPGSDRSAHCINVVWEWIVKHDKKVLWLPSEYRPSVSDVFGSTIALGCESGRVLIMRFS